MVREAPGTSALEVLLVRRNARAAFVPGAYVFPGGVVDAADASRDMRSHVIGFTPAHAAERLGLREQEEQEDGSPAPIAYYVAALREAFEETGILVALATPGRPTPASAVRSAREDLLESRASFAEVLARLGCRLDLGAVEYIAHWITPEAEPRRYDTRFFMVTVPTDAEPIPDPREMTDALWIRPVDAVLRAREGTLPMIRPTVRTLEALVGFESAQAALDAFAGRAVSMVMPSSPSKRNALPARPERPD
jgi:8-oxo-dGTP pyrophosphatase MutT (NUDIX family)